MITIYFKKGSGAKTALNDAIPSTFHHSMKWCEVAKKSEMPKRATFVVHCGEGTPKSRHEWFAASKKTLLCCLPEASEWFQRKLEELRNEDIVIIDAALGRIKAL